MRETRTGNRVSQIAIEKLVAHPGNPNRMSRKNYAKLVRNIERTGRYEPLVVRPCPQKECHSCANRNPDDSEKMKGDCFEIINGHHRWQALRELGCKTADAIVWDIDDREAEVLLATLNRLGGSDVLEKKLALLNRLNKRMQARDLAKLLPLTRTQIERLGNLKRPTAPAKITSGCLANPLVFFLDDKQQEIVKKALSIARQARDCCSRSDKSVAAEACKTKAAKNAAAIKYMAQCFIEQKIKCETETPQV